MINTVLLEAIKDMDIGTAFIAISYLFCWYSALQLGYFFLTNSINIKYVIVVTPFGAIFSLFVRPFIPSSIFQLGFMAGVAILLLVITREHVTRIIMATIFTFFMVCVSLLIIGFPIYTFIKGAETFLSSTRVGIALGTMIESTIPLIVPMICKYFKINLYPQSIRLNTRSVVIVIISTGIFYFLSHSLYKFLARTHNSPEYYVNIIISVATFISLCIFLSIYKRDKKRLEVEQAKLNDAHKKQMAELATTLTILTQNQLDRAYEAISYQTVEAFRGAVLNLAEVLKVHDNDINKVIAKLGDIASQDASENPILKQILLTKRLENLATRLKFVVIGQFDLKEYNDGDFWQLIYHCLNVVTKSFIDLKFVYNVNTAFTTAEKLIRINYITLSFDESEEDIALTINTSNMPDHQYDDWQKMKYHLNEFEFEMFEMFFKEVKNIKKFQYGIIDGRVLSINLTYKKRYMEKYRMERRSNVEISIGGIETTKG